MGGLYLSPDAPNMRASCGNLSGGLDRVSTVNAPTALYRRYRPDSFATLIGQDHVTAPLMAALEKNRVNHAYLFSGPRGCGKTTSARILARCLNCAKGPTSHPCGECDSCIELARGGAGSLDVIEIDAASHGGVDDARDLRERATFAPIRDRYKIFIIDEAHMVTSAGFNALLKIVEEPPEHIKFIFATTEPDKVIGTIRSRTHHYPFRLVPPEPLMAYLAQLCEQENMSVAPGVLSLVVRAGGGSVRDSLSVLDQLMAGAPETGLDYDLAVDLLGYTHSSLLDDVVEALAAADSATVFKSVDRVIQTGHDPRRFVEDLLERFRDLIIVQAMPESAHAILRGTPEELIARMQTQAAQLGAAELSRAADVTNAAFNEMTGATSPRLHLELLGARLLLPGADSSTRGMATRLDQLERRLNYAGTPTASSSVLASAGTPGTPEQGVPTQSYPSSNTASSSAAPAPYQAAPGSSANAPEAAGSSSESGSGWAAVRAQIARAKEAAGAEVAARPSSPAVPGPDAAQPVSPEDQSTPATKPVQPVQREQAVQPVHAEQQVQTPQPSQAARTWDDLPTPSGHSSIPAEQPVAQMAAHQAPAEQSAPQQANGTAASVPSGSSGIEVIRRAWPEITAAVKNIRMASWVFVNQSVMPQTFDGKELRVGIPSTGLITAFSNSGHMANLQQAINQVLGLSVQILPVDGEAPKASSEPNPKVQTGSPSPRREGTGNNAAPPVATSTGHASTGQWQQAAASQPTPGQTAAAPVMSPAAGPAVAPNPATAPASPAPATDDWGLPVEPHHRAVPATEAPSAPPSPATSTAPPAASAPALQPSVSGQTDPSTASAPPAAAQSTASSIPWDGPLEPSDPWDEPYPDFVPPTDPYESGAAYPPADLYHPDESIHTPTGSNTAVSNPATSDQAASSQLTSGPNPAAPPAAEPYVPPKISPIAAWTTGWDAPAVAEPAAAPSTPEAPRRSELLAQQAAHQGTQPNSADSGDPQHAVQDWGVSLGQTRRSDVADPGWGAMSSAPDWAQPGTSAIADSPAPTAETVETVKTAETSTAEQPTAPAAGAQSGSLASSEAVNAPDFTVASVSPAPLAQLAEATQTPAPTQVSDPAQDAPEPNGAVGGEKLSMYQRLANSSEAQAARAQAPAVAAAGPYVEDVPSPDDVTIEESGVVGQAAVERILGGVLVEERALNPNL